MKRTIPPQQLPYLLGNTKNSNLGAAMVGYLPPWVGASGRPLADKLGEYISVTDFGATGDGSTDDSAAVFEANFYAQSQRRTLYFPPGSYLLTTSFQINAAWTSWVGEHARLNFITSPGAYAIQIYSTAGQVDYRQQVRPALKGFWITGSPNAPGTLHPNAGILLGFADPTANDNCSLFSVEDVAIDGFTNPLLFTDNAWKIHFLRCFVRWGTISCPASLTNMGENIVFAQCFFNVNSVTIATGEFHFTGVSFDDGTLQVTGDAAVYCTDCHFENPGKAISGYWIDCNNANALVVLQSCQIVFDERTPPVNYTTCLMRVHDSNTNHGIILRDLHMFQDGYYQPVTDDAHQLLVKGLGRVQCSGIASNDNSNYYVIARSLNTLYNSGAETGDTTGWTLAGAGTFTADNTTAKEGTYSFKLNAPAMVAANISQQFPVRPGDWLMFALWQKGTTNNGNFAHKVRFLHQDGTVVLDSVGAETSTATVANFTLKVGGALVPSGAAWGQIVLSASGGTVTATDAWWDAIIVNCV